MAERRKGFSLNVRNEVKRSQNYKCAYCGREGCLEVHHIIPLSMGGGNHRSNGAALCSEPCHIYMNMKIFMEGKTFWDVMTEEKKEYVIFQME